jgi:hypothetical protein
VRYLLGLAIDDYYRMLGNWQGRSLNKEFCDQNQEHYLLAAKVCWRRNSLTMSVAIARAARAFGCRSQASRHDESMSTKR